MGICDYLRSHRVHFEVLLHPPASCALRLAQRLHVPGRVVAKAVLLRSGGTYLLAVVPATHRVDLARLEAAVGARELMLATESEIQSIFDDCEYGALPPFGRKYGLATVVDASLAGTAEIVAEGNLRHQCVRLRYRDFEALEAPIRARFAITPNHQRRQRRHRQAG